MFALQNPPDTTISNGAKWLEYFGVADTPAWVSSHGFDTVGTYIAGIAVLIAIFALILPYVQRAVRTSNTKGSGRSNRNNSITNTETNLVNRPDGSRDDFRRQHYMPNMTFSEAVKYICLHKSEIEYNAAMLLYWSAHDGILLVWGKPRRSDRSVLELIPKDYWSHAGVAGELNCTVSSTGHIYETLHVSREQITGLWWPQL